MHVLWAAGSTWPLPDAASFAEVIGGQTASDDDQGPGTVSTLAVAGALTAASALVAGFPRRHGLIQRLGTGGVVSVLGIRGVLGVLGKTDLISPESTSPRFRRLDRTVYGPLCLGLAALAVPAVRKSETT